MTSSHEGVSCDPCKKNNFRGLRYKCLICYDYDLCSACYEAGLTSSRHTVNHPVQCIIARNDYDLFYSGESVSSEQPQSLTCPLCGTLGFTETTLLEHVTSEHASSDNDESSAGVVCPICGVEANQLTYDFATHLTMEHRTPRDPIEQVAIRGRGGRCHARTSGPRGRRSQPHYSAVGGPTVSSPSAREPTDPIVEILAQLSGVRRAGGVSNQSPASQLHQLQLHLQSSPSFTTRTANEVRIMRRTFQTMNNQLNSSSTSTSTAPVQNSSNGGGIAAVSAGGGGYTNSNTHYCSSQPFVLMDQSSLGSAGMLSSASSGLANGGVGNLNGVTGNTTLNGAQSGTLPSRIPPEGGANLSPQYLLSRCMKPILTEAEQQQREILKADRSLFVQELLLQVGLLQKDMKS